MYTRGEAVREVDFEYGRGGRRYERSPPQRRRRRGGSGRSVDGFAIKFDEEEGDHFWKCCVKNLLFFFFPQRGSEFECCCDF